jgi:hypothetical protein
MIDAARRETDSIPWVLNVNGNNICTFDESRKNMADYDLRAIELIAKSGEAYKKAVDAETAGGTTPVVHASWINLKGGLDRYIDWRDRAIDDGLTHLEPRSDSDGASQQDRWASYYQSKGTEAYSQIDNLGKGTEDAIQQFVFFVSTQESLFFRQLSQFTFARAAGEIKKTIRELQTEADNLEGKWRELAGLDERADGEIATLRVQFLRELDGAVENLLGWSRKAEAIARTVVTLGAEYDDKSDPKPSFGPIVIQGIEIIAFFERPLESFTREAQRLYDNKAPIHDQFLKLRTRTDEYLSKTYQAGGNAYSAASEESAAKASESATDGNRSDARRFFEKAQKALDPLLSEYRSVVDKFYDQFNGRFVGEVSDETVGKLADQEFFDKFWDEFEDKHIPDALKSVLDDIDDNWGVSLDPLKPETREKVREYFEEKLEPHKNKLRAMDSNFFQRFVEVGRISVRPMWEKLKRSPGYRK